MPPGPESPVEPSGSQEIAVEPVFTAEDEKNKFADGSTKPPSDESIVPKPALDASKYVTEDPSPPKVTPERSPLEKSINPGTPSAAVESAPRTPTENFIGSNRGRVTSLDRVEFRRVVSLDRGRELHADMEGENRLSDFSSFVHQDQITFTHDDEDSLGSNSSDGESSYFAKHLPRPKSGGRFSYSDSASINSAPALYARGSNNMDRETDASLSFSSGSDDDDNHHHRVPGMKIVTSRAPLLPPPVPRGEGSADVPPYSQRITRIHSVNSLVSTSSGEGDVGRGEALDDKARAHSRSDSNGSLSSSGASQSTSSDQGVRTELRHVAVPQTRTASTGSLSTPRSGRMPPVLGAHHTAPFFGEYPMQTPTAPQVVSPPPIYQGQPSAQDMVHPQPQPMMSEQMAAWLAAGSSAYVRTPCFPPAYGATSVMSNPHNIQSPPAHPSKPSHDPVNSSMASDNTAGDRTLPMAYSEDEDETDDGTPGHQKSAKNASKETPANHPGTKETPFERGMPDSFGSGLEGSGDVADTHDFLGMSMYGPEYYVAEKARSGSSDHLTGMGDEEVGDPGGHSGKGFSVYRRRWLMLMYMSVLNLLSDWTCYSVAPISMLTDEAFGRINPEQLVVVFLCANAVATACEPIILSRLGLRRTVVFGALLLMIGSIVKSGGLPPIVKPHLTKGQGEWKVYVGFFLVGLSQPLYQCTPALLSASWFPERERTMATGVALNANQLGIGFAFIFGTLLVGDSDDIVPYFGLLSFISTVTFLGCLVQFDDAPPTPPSDTARVMRGTFQWKLPDALDSFAKSIRQLGDSDARERSGSGLSGSSTGGKSQQSDRRASRQLLPGERSHGSSKESQRTGKKSRQSSCGKRSSSDSPRPTSRKQDTDGQATAGGSSTRRRTASSRKSATSESGLVAAGRGLAPPPSPASTARAAASEIAAFEQEAYNYSVFPPSRMMPGQVGAFARTSSYSEDESPPFAENEYQLEQTGGRIPSDAEPALGLAPPLAQYVNQYPGNLPMGYLHPQWQQQPYWDPGVGTSPPYFQHPGYQQHPGYFPQQGNYYYPQSYYYPHMYPNPNFGPYDDMHGLLPNASDVYEGAEPTLTITDHHLEIDIRDDQIIRSTRACFSKPGFVHALVAFTVSGIVINTLSTFMDYLVRLNGAGREYVGIVGGSFQFVIMISSLIIGKATDKTRAYYSVILAMLVCGAFGLAECGVSLDSNRGSDLRWTLVVVAALVGPLQPVSTELGVDVVYPLSENTVLVIQQLFSNLLSAMFIPFFKALKDVGTEAIDDADMIEKPKFTFSFYLLIVLHATATVFFATFNGRYLRYEQEMAKKAQHEAKMMFMQPTAFHRVQDNYRPLQPYEQDDGVRETQGTERQPLLRTSV